MKKLVLVDGNALMHRSYHGVGKGFIPMYEGMPIGMAFGFASTMLHIIDHFMPEVLFVTFDTKEKTFRHKADENYKAHRPKAPDDFYPQLPYVYEFLESFEIPIFKMPGYESDDIIGTMARKAEQENYSVKILSGDMDFLQLVSPQVHFLKFNGAIEKSIEYGPDETQEKLGITVAQVIDYKALTGDSSDNYKGIEGLGPKTAVKFLSQYQSIEGIYAHLSQLPDKWRLKFEENREYLAHCKMLATIDTQVPIDFSLDQMFDLSPETSLSFLEKMKFYSLVGRFKRLNKKFEQKGVATEKETQIQASLF